MNYRKRFVYIMGIGAIFAATACGPSKTELAAQALQKAKLEAREQALVAFSQLRDSRLLGPEAEVKAMGVTEPLRQTGQDLVMISVTEREIDEFRQDAWARSAKNTLAKMRGGVKDLSPDQMLKLVGDFMIEWQQSGRPELKSFDTNDGDIRRIIGRNAVEYARNHGGIVPTRTIIKRIPAKPKKTKPARREHAGR